jgi:hypothetical protein
MLYCISVNDIQQASKPAGVVNVVNVVQAGNWPEKKISLQHRAYNSRNGLG